MSPRSIRILYSAIALIVLGICVINLLDIMVYNATANDQCAWRPIEGRKAALRITDVVPGGVAEKAGIKDGDILLKINGQSFEGNNAQFIINKVPVGEYARYTIERDGVLFETDVQILRVFNIAFLAQFLLGLGFLIVGSVVVLTKPQGNIQRMFARYSILSMLFFGLYIISLNQGDPAWKFTVLGLSSSLARLLAPPIFVTFFFYFPFRKPVADRKWIRWCLYIASAGLLTMAFAGRFTQTLMGVIGLFVPYAFYVVGLCVFVHSYIKLDKQRRKPLRSILISAVIGVAALFYTIALGASNPFLIFLYPASFLPGLLILSVPIGFGYSIFRYRLMDIDLIVKRSLIYGGVTAALAAIYLLIVYGVGTIVSYVLGTEENKILNVIAFIFIALAFDPIKRRTQEWIDRYFYQERYNYQKALLEFSQDLPRQMNLEQILNSVVSRISSTMHVEKVAVVLCDEAEGCLSISQNIDRSCCEFGNAQNGLIELLRDNKSPQSLSFIEDEGEVFEIDPQDKSKIVRSGITLAVPMILADRLIGTINVGPKMSGKAYSQEDIDLLSTVASQAAIAIENARLHTTEIEKQKIEEEMALARKIQQGLLPKSDPAINGLDVTGVSLPALSVGGDYFDFIQLNEKKLLVVVADVSGKGMSAALYMSKIQGMMQLASHMYDSPRDMLIHVNRRLYDGIERKSFITMILALFDLESKEVRICRAGHNRAIVGVNGTMEYLISKGIGLGLERGPLFESHLQEVSYPLTDNSLFFFYSDGLTEAMDTQQQQFGEEAICDLVRINRNLPAREIQRSVIQAVERFKGEAEQHDDITLVVVKYR